MYWRKEKIVYNSYFKTGSNILGQHDLEKNESGTKQERTIPLKVHIKKCGTADFKIKNVSGPISYTNYGTEYTYIPLKLNTGSSTKEEILTTT